MRLTKVQKQQLWQVTYDENIATGKLADNLRTMSPEAVTQAIGAHIEADVGWQNDDIQSLVTAIYDAARGRME